MRISYWSSDVCSSDLLRACRIGQLLERARAYATRGKVHHPHPGRVIVGIGHQAQVRQRVLDFLAFEKAQSAVYLVGNARRKQRVLEYARLRIATVQHGNLAAQADRKSKRLNSSH